MPGMTGKFQIGVAVRLFVNVPSTVFQAYETFGVFSIAAGVCVELISNGMGVEKEISLIMGEMISWSTTRMEIVGEVTVSPFSETMHFN
jgi:hypothetical protein